MQASSWLLFALLSNVAVSSTLPRQLQWSSKTYGPDGPWHAVSIYLGSNKQPLDLYPGNTWHSNILGSSICTDVVPCYAQQAGVYNPSASTSALTFTFVGDIEQVDWTSGAMPLTGTHAVQFDTAIVPAPDLVAPATIPNLSLQVIPNAYYTLPNGTTYPPEVGTLALGAESVNQTYPVVDSVSNFNASLISGYLYEAGQLASNSYGLHIGSVALGIPPSALVGGYDQSRVLGVVTAQSYQLYNLPIDLLDIGIGVAEGGSPFADASFSGLLAQGNSSIGSSIPVLIEATIPYLYLPGSTCDAIAAQLPVTFNSDYDLYFWNITAPNYTRIVTSPAYLSFTFRLNQSNSQNMTIKVPFSLLNLTLQAPLINTPTQYFPCRPLTDAGSYTLGRAFLQAAFVGVNWQTDLNGVWFLAQAPGPNTPSTAIVTSIGFSDTNLTTSSNQWIDSWKDSWTVLDEGTSGTGGGSSGTNGTTPGNQAVSKSKSLSSGAIAGIVIGVVVLIAAVGALAYFCFRRRNHIVQLKGRSVELVQSGPGGTQCY
ncbi:uncharacterized protein LY89DRAFT_693389 [Mollisia scopiformis]|uniref:Peptidase A1 domain-containing protein n=1 Tax=Mollisia scopiformis TaxID=149040 RepID=A0A194XSV3_MOLSC|nr:uncharacterized protein LY89DRAFT_693389 [Mollisia scopiformis]KUJ23119.1 hypothetical protein LY89DRAFT_693389 [Mollisia scopiformis]